ncbi:DNA translocase FtsK [Roseixanthobacter liquoris]|uniref:DNA translocase FtsK n=1 Tax=Roseixanthobacter liquoris TaxID=3119921 RepID=UPI003729F17C
MPSSNRPPRTYEPSFFNAAQAGGALPAGRPLLPKEAREAAFSPWVALELVPSWLRPFTLDENTRFTRTPDHFLRTRHGLGESPKVTSAPPVQPRPAARDAVAPEVPGSAPADAPGGAAPSPASGPASGPTWRFLVEETEPETQTASMAWSDAAEPAVALETLRAAIVEILVVAVTQMPDAAAPALAPPDMAEAAVLPALPADPQEVAAQEVAAQETDAAAAEDQRREIALRDGQENPVGERAADAIEGQDTAADGASLEIAAAPDAERRPALAPEAVAAAAMAPDAEASNAEAPDVAVPDLTACDAPAAIDPAADHRADGPACEAEGAVAPSAAEPELAPETARDAMNPAPGDATSPDAPEVLGDPSAGRALPETLLKLGRLIRLGEGITPRAAAEQDLQPAPAPHDAAVDEASPDEPPPDAPLPDAPLACDERAGEAPPEGEPADDARAETLSSVARPAQAAAVAEATTAPAAEPATPAVAPIPLEPLSAIVGASFHWAFQGLNFRPETGMPPAPSPIVPAAPVAPAPSPAAPSRAVEAAEEDGAYELPALALLREPPVEEPDFELSEEFLDQSSAILQQTLRDFGVRGEVIDANPGPVVTLYEFEPAPGTKSSRVIGLAADIARSMSAVSVRVAVVEGRNVIGIELPNRRRGTVWLRELLEGPHLDEAHAKLAIALGKTIGGAPVIVDLARMPHLLVAGTTGSGKSVAINTMILSLLYRHSPQACRLIMIDPKMLELSVYEGIPHLLTPVVTDPKKAIIALKWAVREMEDRYRKMSRLGVRNIDGFNARMAEARAKGEIIKRQVQVGFDKETGEALFEEQDMDLTALPFIVIIVDEMADLMLTAGKEIEGAIQRLAQMARAAGIHLVMATQRPSVDVITGTIKANFPTRISFQVTSKIDSRTILGEMGAEQLLGQGDMLYMASGGRITRVHGPFVSDGEVEKVVAHLKAQGGPEYLDAVTSEDEGEGVGDGDDAVFDKGALGEAAGDLYEQAVAIVLRDRKASTSYIQRRLQVGYNKAASLMERMETEGIVGPANHAGKREILTGARSL